MALTTRTRARPAPLLAAALALSGGCLAPLRAADPAQRSPGRADEAVVEVEGVSFALRPGNGDGWLGDIQDLLAVQVTIRNRSAGAVRVHTGQFSVLTAHNRVMALAPGAVVMRTRTGVPRPRPLGPPRNVISSGSGARRGGAALDLLYAWPGLRGVGPAVLDGLVGPDPRPRPEGNLEPGAVASVVLFFPVTLERAREFALEVAVEGEEGKALGTGRAPFSRG